MKLAGVNMKTKNAIIFLFIFFLSIEFAYASEQKVMCLLYVVEKSWEKRDGGFVSIVHTSIIELLSISPHKTMKWLIKKDEIREELLSKLQYTVFTDYKGKGEEELKNLKIDLIEKLEINDFGDGETDKLRNRLLNILKKLTIRSID